MNSILRKCQEERRFNKIIRNVDEEEFIDMGFILNYSNELVLLQNEDDFLLDGYSIIKREEIQKIRYNHFDKYFELMLESEGIKKEVGILYDINLQNWQAAFKSIAKYKGQAIIRCDKKGDGRFLIGPLQEITATSVYIQYFNADGYLNKKPTKVLFEDVTKVEFDSRYLNVFSKYLRTKA